MEPWLGHDPHTSEMSDGSLSRTGKGRVPSNVRSSRKRSTARILEERRSEDWRSTETKGSLFFLEHAGELCIISLEEEKKKQYIQ
jgi:hypothetical protein